jgi:hypothetical protein
MEYILRNKVVLLMVSVVFCLILYKQYTYHRYVSNRKFTVAHVYNIRQIGYYRHVEFTVKIDNKLYHLEKPLDNFSNSVIGKYFVFSYNEQNIERLSYLYLFSFANQNDYGTELCLSDSEISDYNVSWWDW